MSEYPAVSLVIPVYNTEKYLSEMLRSACAQTLRKLEIICVDDCSTDNSRNILHDFAACDARVRIVRNPRNMGAALARKHGISESRGEFLMFADSDDLLQPNACGRALELIRQNQCDMLQFNIRRLNGDVLSGSNDTFMPYSGRIERHPLIEPWLSEGKFAHTLWGKIYRGDICRHAAEQMADDVFSCALDDYYTFFAIAFFSRSYCGIPDEFLYTYREYIGIGAGVVSTLHSVNLLPAFEDFLRRQNALEQSRNILAMIRNRLYNSGVGILLRTRKLEPAMFEEAVRCWGAQILYDFIVRLGVFNVETDDRNYILPRLADTVMKLRAGQNC